jgi:hypothetical protein
MMATTRQRIVKMTMNEKLDRALIVMAYAVTALISGIICLIIKALIYGRV